MTPKVLVVDDELISLNLLKKVLELKGYSVTGARNGEQAITALDGGAFDLVITDLEMGETSGLEVIEKAKRTSPEPIVIMVSGCSEEHCVIDAFRHGADDFVRKPFSITDLFDRILFQERKHSLPRTSRSFRGVKIEKVSEKFTHCKTAAFQ